MKKIEHEAWIRFIYFAFAFLFILHLANYPPAEKYNPVSWILKSRVMSGQAVDDKLDLIIIQNWIVIALVGFMTIAVVITNLKNKKRSDGLVLKDMWETNQIDRIIERTDVILGKTPLNEDALYFRARALWTLKRREAALDCFKRLRSLSPSYLDSLNKFISQLEKEIEEDKSKPASH